MNVDWQEFLQVSGARFSGGLVADFGDSEAELAVARDATIVSPLVHLGLIECAGDDTKSFLHNQLTSDVNHLLPEFAQHSAWCTAKGRMLASLLLYRSGSDIRALLSSDLSTSVVERLKMFVLRSRVTIADLSSDFVVFGVSGPQVESVLRNAGLPIPAKLREINAFDNGHVIRLDLSRLVIVVGKGAAAGMWNELAANAVPVGTPVWQWLDIQAGIPLITDATKEVFVPQMANFDRIDAISFHKGCYPGQEVVARTQYLGKVKRHLYRIHTDCPVASGAAIYPQEAPEQPCGTVANAAPAPGGGYDALAVVQESHVDTDEAALNVPGGPIATIEPVV